MITKPHTPQKVCQGCQHRAQRLWKELSDFHEVTDERTMLLVSLRVRSRHYSTQPNPRVTKVRLAQHEEPSILSDQSVTRASRVHLPAFSAHSNWASR